MSSEKLYYVSHNNKRLIPAEDDTHLPMGQLNALKTPKHPWVAQGTSHLTGTDANRSRAKNDKFGTCGLSTTRKS